MKILMVSMPSLHFFRWTEQLENSGHEVFWFDIKDGGKKIDRISWVHQIVGWKLRWDFPGRIYIKKRFPKLYSYIQRVNERNVSDIFRQKLEEIQPDAVHSFALYVSCVPIFDVMKDFENIKWIYSSWGSDLFFFQNIPSYLTDIKKVLPHIDFLFTDCKRDYSIAKSFGFTGVFLGVFPGGGGFDLKLLQAYKKTLIQRKTIIIKGFENRSGRALNVLKALASLKNEFEEYSIIVFGADVNVFEFLKKSALLNWSNFEVLGKIPHEQILKLMGESIIYIGNSNSDGIPNTLLESICSGAFPIQSNPGGASEEVIKNGVNGFIIEDCENIEEIKNHLINAFKYSNLFINAFNYNSKLSNNYDRDYLTKKVIEKYAEVVMHR